MIAERYYNIVFIYNWLLKICESYVWNQKNYKRTIIMLYKFDLIKNLIIYLCLKKKKLLC